MGLGDVAPFGVGMTADDGSEAWNLHLTPAEAANLGIEAASIKEPGELFSVVAQSALP
jgi:hypothetical protein